MTVERQERPHVLVVSDDRNFLRFAGAVLGNDGHRTARSSVSPRRIQCLARLHAPDVLVLDAGSDAVAVAEVCSTVMTQGLAIGLVLVSDEPPVALHLPVVARWCSPETLVTAVAQAGGGIPRAEGAAVDEPGPGVLRLVPERSA